MALHFPTFFKRLGSAIVFSIIMMAGLLWNVWAFVALTGLIMLLCIREYTSLFKKIFYNEAEQTATIDISLLSFIGAAFCFFSSGAIHLFLSEYQWVATCLLVLGIVITTSLFLSTILKETINMQQWNLFSSSMLYIVMPIILLLYLRSLSLSIPLALILMIWMNDTMAYLVGSFIGKTPFSKISPKKTWEGTLGGVLLTLIGAAIWGYYAPYYRMIDWMALALCAAIAGTMGDLLESKLKRLAGLKDSGTMMPGHGGALDRFDSLLVATPFAFGYAYIFMPPLPLVVF